MERKKFIRNFARRLVAIMRREGYEAKRSKAGVDFELLSKITGCSYQMARKYALGEVLPDLDVILKIASWFRISPSWLIFGDKDNVGEVVMPAENTIEIDQALLRYILERSICFLSLAENANEALNFIMETIYDASHLHADQQTIYKIIDMMVSSASLLDKNNKGNKAYDKAANNN